MIWLVMAFLLGIAVGIFCCGIWIVLGMDAVIAKHFGW